MLSILYVMAVCSVFWLVFSIMGVEFYRGAFYKCLNAAKERLSPDEIPDKESCLKNPNYTWTNSKINFDNVMEGFLALYQVVSIEYME
jgi:voltage-gated cation channel